MSERKPVLGDTPRPTVPPHMKRWMGDWETVNKDIRPPTNTKVLKGGYGSTREATPEELRDGAA